jgi:hypothetical protein
LDVFAGGRDPLDMALDQLSITIHGLGAVRLQVVAQHQNDERLDLGGWHASDGSSCRLSLQHGLGDVIAVARAILIGMARAHAVAAVVKQAPAQDSG